MEEKKNKEGMKVEAKTIRLFSRMADSLRPKPPMKISDWADANRELPSESSAEPGKWNTSRAEYQREIMNCVNDPKISRVIIMSSAQVGKTEIALNTAGYYIDYEPSSIGFVQSSLEEAKTFSKERIATMIRDTKCLRGKVKEPRAKDGDNTILHKSFPGGHLTIMGANSAKSLRSKSIRILLMDEVDGYPIDVEGEGDPCDLARKRTNTFWNRKIMMISTPTIKGVSRIEKAFMEGTQEEWCVKCPCCGKYNTYEFKRLDFSTMEMSCEYCSESATRMEWKKQPHKWIAANPEALGKGRRSFHMNEMCSPWKLWEEIVDDWNAANKRYKELNDVSALKTFINTSLGLPWEERGSGADGEELYKRRERYEAELPDGVLLLTAGIDVQDDRFEVEVCGWGKGLESWGIRKVKMYTDTSAMENWEQLEKFVAETEFSFANGNKLKIAAAGLDSGGHRTNQAYQFLERMEKKKINIYGVKGYANKPGIPLIYKRTEVKVKDKNGNVIGNTHIFILGVDSGKDDIVSWLGTTKQGPRYCHFPDNHEAGYDLDHMRQLCSEEKIVKIGKDGKTSYGWRQKKGVRNEALDIRNYAYAIEEILHPDWDALEKLIVSGINYMEPRAKKKKKRRKIQTNTEI